jgi:hypothetical protein
MSSAAKLRVASSTQVLEHLSIGEPVQDTRVTGLLDLDPLVVSRWLCGEDLRGIYQPIIVRHSVLDGLDLEGRTFYEIVELVGCHVTAAHFKHAYFYSSLLVEDCIFEGEFDGRGIQSDGRVVFHHTVFAGWADFSALSVRGRADLVDVSFPGGTNLLRILANGSHDMLGREVNFRGCRFRPVDIPTGLEAARCGILPLGERGPGGVERQWREFAGREEGDPVDVVVGPLFTPHHVGAVDDDDVRTAFVLTPGCDVK